MVGSMACFFFCSLVLHKGVTPAVLESPVSMPAPRGNNMASFR
jgi:hypothetical protein